MMVAPDATAEILLIDNKTHGQVRLTSNANGEGAVQPFCWERDKVRVKSLTYSGSHETTQAIN
jgi:hypothetical protein